MTVWRHHDNRIRDLEDLSRKLIQRVMQLEDRHDKALRHGKVTDVDPKKQLARMEIGNQDGTTVKSPDSNPACISADDRSRRALIPWLTNVTARLPSGPTRS